MTYMTYYDVWPFALRGEEAVLVAMGWLVSKDLRLGSRED